MIAFSSFRPLAKCSPERQSQYIAANESWEKVFSEVHYFNSAEPLLASPKTVFVGQPDPDERPAIVTLARYAAQQDEWAALINADIVVSEKMAGIETHFKKHRIECAISRRYLHPLSTQPIDWGLDFFCALPYVWDCVANQIPEVFKLGKVRFDTWLCSFLSRKWPQTCFDLTPSKLIFHPQHEEREDQMLTDPDDWYLKNPAYPTKRLILV